MEKKIELTELHKVLQKPKPLGLHLYVLKGKIMLDCRDGCSRGAMIDKQQKDGLHHPDLFDQMHCTAEEIRQAWKIMTIWNRK